MSMVEPGKTMTVMRIGGKPEVKHFLENLGFVPDAKVCVVASLDGNLIVHIRDGRVAISKDMAGKIFVA